MCLDPIERVAGVLDKGILGFLDFLTHNGSYFIRFVLNYPNSFTFAEK